MNKRKIVKQQSSGYPQDGFFFFSLKNRRPIRHYPTHLLGHSGQDREIVEDHDRGRDVAAARLLDDLAFQPWLVLGPGVLLLLLERQRPVPVHFGHDPHSPRHRLLVVGMGLVVEVVFVDQSHRRYRQIPIRDGPRRHCCCRQIRAVPVVFDAEPARQQG